MDTEANEKNNIIYGKGNRIFIEFIVKETVDGIIVEENDNFIKVEIIDKKTGEKFYKIVNKNVITGCKVYY